MAHLGNLGLVHSVELGKAALTGVTFYLIVVIGDLTLEKSCQKLV